jgi:hypothetical protein
MAEFCLNYEKAVKEAANCKDMADRLDALLSPPQPRLNDRRLCADTTACLPCRVAANEMLKQCGYDEEMRPIFERMHFSKSLREYLAQ